MVWFRPQRVATCPMTRILCPLHRSGRSAWLPPQKLVSSEQRFRRVSIVARIVCPHTASVGRRLTSCARKFWLLRTSIRWSAVLVVMAVAGTALHLIDCRGAEEGVAERARRPGRRVQPGTPGDHPCVLPQSATVRVCILCPRPDQAQQGLGRLTCGEPGQSSGLIIRRWVRSPPAPLFE